MRSSLDTLRVTQLISLRTVEDGAGFGKIEAEFQPKVLVALSQIHHDIKFRYPEGHPIDFIEDG